MSGSHQRGTSGLDCRLVRSTLKFWRKEKSCQHGPRATKLLNLWGSIRLSFYKEKQALERRHKFPSFCLRLDLQGRRTLLARNPGVSQRCRWRRESQKRWMLLWGPQLVTPSGSKISLVNRRDWSIWLMVCCCESRWWTQCYLSTASSFLTKLTNARLALTFCLVCWKRFCRRGLI